MKLPKKSAAITPHLTVRDVERAARFYEKALGFQVKFMLPGAQGRAMHAELSHRNSTLMLGPESSARGMVAPATSGHIAPVSLYVYVEDVDAQHRIALEAGARELLSPQDQFFGARTSMVMDPDGHQWMLAEHQTDVTIEAMESALHAARGEPRKDRGQVSVAKSASRVEATPPRPGPPREAKSKDRFQLGREEAQASVPPRKKP